METKRTISIYSICITLVICIFAVCSIALLAVGVVEYKNIAINNLESYELRTSLSYVATKVRQADAEDMIVLEERDGLKILSVREKIGKVLYENAIYFYEGKMYEYYHMYGRPFSPESGFEIMGIEDFDFELLENGMLRLTAQDGKGKTECLYLGINSYIY